MKIITAQDLADYSKEELFKNALKYLEEDLNNWQEFKKSPRHAVHFKHGVFEQMPVANNDYYTSKYVNAHPNNPKQNKLSIVATGMLADVETGYPQIFCDMTILTAIRTAATSALAAKYLALKDSQVLGLIGTGAQSEFQTYALRQLFDIKIIRYYDRDKEAMEKYRNNLKDSGVELIACKSGEEVVQGVDIITTCICEKKHVVLFPYESIKDREVFINGIGGDCPGKTELDPEILKHSKIFLEYFEQTKVEGEIQNREGEVDYTELWELVQGKKQGRIKGDKIILFDSVGFAVADFSMLRMLHKLGIGKEVQVLPDIKNPKDLFTSAFEV